MRSYFSQFGTLTRLRLARNKLSGASRHFGFMEFASLEVAKIVAATMDKYLMFGHILQVRLIPREQVHPQLFKGAGKRFKPVPRNKMLGRKLRLGMDRKGWDIRSSKEKKRREERAEKLKEMGYEFENPELKSVDVIPRRDVLAADGETVDGTNGAEQPRAIESKAYQPEETVDDVLKAQAVPAEQNTKEKVKVKKPKKSKAA